MTKIAKATAKLSKVNGSTYTFDNGDALKLAAYTSENGSSLAPSNVGSKVSYYALTSFGLMAYATTDISATLDDYAMITAVTRKFTDCRHQWGL